MEIEFFNEIDAAGRRSGRVVAAKAAQRLPETRSLHRWQIDESAYADNELSVQVASDGFVVGYRQPR